MDVYQIEIIEPAAKTLLEDLAKMNLIRFRGAAVNGDKKQESLGVEELMALAGSWDDMSEADFQEYLSEAKRSGREVFARDVNL